jgi:hypothetical protein
MLTLGRGSVLTGAVTLGVLLLRCYLGVRAWGFQYRCCFCFGLVWKRLSFGRKDWSQNQSDFDIMHLKSFFAQAMLILLFLSRGFPPSPFCLTGGGTFLSRIPRRTSVTYSHAVRYARAEHAREVQSLFFYFPFTARVAFVSISTPPIDSQFTSRLRAISLVKRSRDQRSCSDAYHNTS